jgi:hypothetical protein
MTIARRNLLRAAGVSVALPLLPSILPRGERRAEAAPGPKRFVAYYVPNGFLMKRFWPALGPNTTTLSPILAPLAPVKDDVLIVSGLDNNPGKGAPGDHPMGTAAFLTAHAAVRTGNGADVRAATSVDQVIAKAIDPKTAGTIPSLQLASEGASRGPTCDFFTCTYTDNISWSSATQPMPKTTNVGVLFDQLFGARDEGASAAAQQRQAQDKSILDNVQRDAASLANKLGARDRARLDEYLTAIRDVEMRITAAAPSSGMCAGGTRPASTLSLPQQVDVMGDLMTLALACDRTRVITYMLGNGATERTHPFLSWSGGAINDAYHPLTHSAQDDAWWGKITEICKWEVARFASFVQKLKGVQTAAGGTLLDESLIMFSSEMADPSDHGHVDMPLVLAGRLGGAINASPGRTIKTSGTFGDLFVTFLNAFGVQATSFGDDGRKTLAL